MPTFPTRLEIEIVRGGTRYCDAQNEIKLTTDAKGGFSMTWPKAGMCWLETNTEDEEKNSQPQAVISKCRCRWRVWCCRRSAHRWWK